MPIISRLLGILAVLSLLIAPMAMPSHAAMTRDVSTASASDKLMTHMAVSDMAGSHATAMAKAIPCCPHKKPGSTDDCGKSCPMALLCMAKLLPRPPLAKDFMPIRVAASVMQVPRDDMWRDLLAEPPPPEPPRS